MKGSGVLIEKKKEKLMVQELNHERHHISLIYGLN